MRAIVGALLAMIAVIVSGCRDCIEPKFQEVKGLLDGKLKVGDTRERVEEVLKSAEIGYTYDRFSNRYQSTVRDARCEPYAAVSVYVNLDTSGKVSKVEVSKTYTSL